MQHAKKDDKSRLVKIVKKRHFEKLSFFKIYQSIGTTMHFGRLDYDISALCSGKLSEQSAYSVLNLKSKF